jgi:negative regulator of replication initiation
MKTERMVLLVTPEEKALIAKRAAQLGVSASEFVRRAVEMFDPDDAAALAELETLVPELKAMAQRIEQGRAELPRIEAEREARRAYYSSDAYREEVRQQLLSDPGIDWDRAREFFGGFKKAAA